MSALGNLSKLPVTLLPTALTLISGVSFQSRCQALTIMSWATGNAAVIDASNYCAESILSSLKTCRPISLSLFVTAVKSIARAPNYSTDAIKSVRFVHLIGSTVTMAILQAAQKTFPRAKMLTSFAKTEPTATTSWPAGRPPTMDKMPSWHGIASSGKVAAGAALKVVDAQGKIVKRGQVGSLHLRGSSVISRYVDGGGGYSNSNDAFYTGEDGHQWFVSGDDALIDDKGFLYVLGRSEYTLRREGQVIIACSVEDFLEMQFQGSTVSILFVLPSFVIADDLSSSPRVGCRCEH